MKNNEKREYITDIYYYELEGDLEELIKYLSAFKKGDLKTVLRRDSRNWSLETIDVRQKQLDSYYRFEIEPAGIDGSSFDIYGIREENKIEKEKRLSANKKRRESAKRRKINLEKKKKEKELAELKRLKEKYE